MAERKTAAPNVSSNRDCATPATAIALRRRKNGQSRCPFHLAKNLGETYLLDVACDWRRKPALLGRFLPKLRAARKGGLFFVAASAFGPHFLGDHLEGLQFGAPNPVDKATSVASRPVAMRMRPIRGTLCRASKVYQRSPR